MGLLVISFLPLILVHDWFFLLPFNNLFPHSNIYCFLYPEPSYSKWIPYDSGTTQIQLYSRNIQCLFPYSSQTSYIMSYWGIQLLPPILYYNYASSSSLCFQFSFKHVISFLYKILYLNAIGKEHKVFCQIWKRKKKRWWRRWGLRAVKKLGHKWLFSYYKFYKNPQRDKRAWWTHTTNKMTS